MGFWVFMFAAALIIPITMLVFGNLFQKGVPDNVNWTFGYRTARSMKSKETWKFAHQYIGAIWRKLGMVLLILTIIAMVIIPGESVKMVGIYAGIIVLAQIIVMISAIFPTENALKRNFDENGKRR